MIRADLRGCDEPLLTQHHHVERIISSIIFESSAKLSVDYGIHPCPSVYPTHDVPLRTPLDPLWHDHRNRTTGVIQFRGIPYARAGRFEKPVAVTSWQGQHLEAIHRGPVCPQPPSPLDPLITGNDPLKDMTRSEDCQHLTVTIPRNARERPDKLNVMVWIHGGSYVIGSGESATFDAQALASEQDVIIVSLSYRLGLFGFLGDGEGREANLGLFDLLEGLRWIQRNIVAFGGNPDPRSVTLFGESAGASAIADLMLVEEATELFGRVIIQSAPLGISRGRAKMNSALNEAARKISRASSIEDILETTTLVQGVGKAWGLVGSMPFSPAYGHAPLPSESEVDKVRSTVAPKIAVLIGNNWDEATLFLGQVPLVGRLKWLPFVGSWIQNAAVQWLTGALYRQSAIEFVRMYRDAGGHVSRYELTYCVAGNEMKSTHTIDLPLLFPNKSAWSAGRMLKGVDWDEMQVKGRALRGLWADFARGRQLTASDTVPGLVDLL